MKLTHFALAGLVLLLGAGVYLTMQSDMDGRLDEQKAAYDRKIQELERAIKDQAKTVAAAPKEAIASVADTAKDKAGTAADEVKSALTKVADSVKDTASRETGKLTDAAGTAAGKVKAAATDITARAQEEIDRLAGKTGATGNPAATDVPGAVKSTVADAADRTARAVTTAADAAAETVDEATRRLLDKEQREILNTTGVATERMAADNAALAGGADDPEKMTKLQEMIKGQPAIARITDSGDGFVVLDRGSEVGLTRGDSFAVRRGTFLIGRITIGDTIQPRECVADITKVFSPGMSFRKGDEIIKFDR